MNDEGRCPFCGQVIRDLLHIWNCDGQQGKVEAEAERLAATVDVDPWTNVRVSDPDTSVLAALLDPGGRQTLRKRTARLLVEAWPGTLTDYDLADLTGRQQNSVGKRRGELMREGLVRDSGERRPGPSKSPCIAWIWCGPVPKVH